MRIEEVETAPRSPWQNPFAERVIGSVPRELTDHVIVLDERHFLRLRKSCVEHYNESRSHPGLDKDALLGREVPSPGRCQVVATPPAGRLRHRFERRGA
jgi:transposase InsO family protein